LDKYLEANHIEPNSAGAVAVFVLGVLTGYIVDGVLIYETGKSAGQWVADALSYFSTYRGRVKEIFCNSTRVNYITDSSGCILRSGSHIWDSPY